MLFDIVIVDVEKEGAAKEEQKRRNKEEDARIAEQKARDEEEERSGMREEHTYTSIQTHGERTIASEE